MTKSPQALKEERPRAKKGESGVRALQSERRRHDILSAANKVLRQGVAEFSLRKVAAAADVHLNTVQHHFKDVDSLLYATLEFGGREINARFAEIVQGQNGDPVDDFEVFLDEAWITIRNVNDRRFFLELWAMAVHKPAINEMVRRMYGEYRTTLEGIIRRVNPALTDAEVVTLAILICSWTEGAVVMAQCGGDGGPSLSLLSIRMKSACLGLLGISRTAAPVERG